MAVSARARNHSQHRFYSPRQLDDHAAEQQALLDEARAGSRPAHGELLNQLRPKMLRYFGWRLCRSKLAAKADEEDLAQEATLHALQKFAQLRGATLRDYTRWLMAICRNALRALERIFRPGSDRDLTREELLDELRLEMDSQRPFARRRVSAPDILAALETAGQLQAALATLSAEERQIVTWRQHDALTFAAIALRLQTSDDWVERAYQRCLKRLKKCLAFITEPAEAVVGVFACSAA